MTEVKQGNLSTVLARLFCMRCNFARFWAQYNNFSKENCIAIVKMGINQRASNKNSGLSSETGADMSQGTCLKERVSMCGHVSRNMSQGTCLKVRTCLKERTKGNKNSSMQC